jgi:hypothetical protein
MIMGLIVYIMLQAEDYKSAANGLKYVLQLLPHFSITFGFLRFSDQVLKNNKCKITTVFCPGDDICCRKFVQYLIHIPVRFNYMFTEVLMATYGYFLVNCNVIIPLHVFQLVISMFIIRCHIVIPVFL